MVICINTSGKYFAVLTSHSVNRDLIRRKIFSVLQLYRDPSSITYVYPSKGDKRMRILIDKDVFLV